MRRPQSAVTAGTDNEEEARPSCRRRTASSCGICSGLMHAIPCALERLDAIAARSPDPVDRRALEGCFRNRRNHREQALAGVSVAAAEVEETRAEGELNNAQLQRHLRDDATSRARVRECATRQLHATEQLLEALGSK